MGAFLALLSSVSWGTGDFLGGTLSRRVHPLVVMRDAQGIAFFGLVVVAFFTRELDASGYLWWGVAGGLVGVVSLGCFYAALAGGTMGVVAPVAATGAIVPIGVGIAEGESPSALQLVGHRRRGGRRRAGVGSRAVSRAAPPTTGAPADHGGGGRARASAPPSCWWRRAASTA